MDIEHLHNHLAEIWKARHIAARGGELHEVRTIVIGGSATCEHTADHCTCCGRTFNHKLECQ
ncbi:hypothetical protein Q4603_05795 [Zobellia galactanivorans]|uniref:hypothetical protein n=1 Tax=Zobellia galactanivorans (strain DSM 12802 / CCUG 47099 / CIP 106680 / NCIMB 13871 / Dsij) TaxID=63186 RepID=UPI0026E2ECF3|nr:hypothetical protein [Zobellia galactanivorans]MDO6808108.1 hypothetical protein [Zobellia galactanivorans]